uniref:Uncharacterized protein n=1 Tax=Oryza sativa subsp. japonica TaxID=39947 RepID=Q5Z4Z1_ORYSJ|nr:hypothetical protein [Oryza sativa Japonica Group]
MDDLRICTRAQPSAKCQHNSKYLYGRRTTSGRQSLASLLAATAPDCRHPVGEEAALAVADGDGAALGEDVGEVGVLDKCVVAVVEGGAAEVVGDNLVVVDGEGQAVGTLGEVLTATSLLAATPGHRRDCHRARPPPRPGGRLVPVAASPGSPGRRLAQPPPRPGGRLAQAAASPFRCLYRPPPPRPSRLRELLREKR